MPDASTKKPALYVGLCGDAPRAAPARISLAGADRVDLGRAEVRRIEREGAAIAVSLVDLRMSTRHARLLRGDGGWVLEDLQSKNGTVMGQEKIARRALADGDAFIVGHTVLVFRGDAHDDTDLDGAPAAPAPGLATLSPELAARFRELADAALGAGAIELAGEPGVGKAARGARAVHAVSGRAGADLRARPPARAGPRAAGAVNSLLLGEVADYTPRAQLALRDLIRAGLGDGAPS
ncbi:MAG: FHA domain-containing protein [Deltaproteobacteria bacterium]|nr:FHA domain-containing protein [Deltaproteobacteria bacterium]